MEQEETILLPSLRFPQKLWYIINKCESGAISWSSTGCTILLHYQKFQEEYLSSDDKIFKTNNINSFIRQLNMYGFRKVASHRSEIANIGNQNVHEFVHENFQRGRFDLLDKVLRKTGTRIAKFENITEDDFYIKIKTEDCYEESFELPMTQLQACQVGLREALHQATIQYEAMQTRKVIDELEDFDYEEFKFYFIESADLFKHHLETITLYVPKLTDIDNFQWYSEALMNFMKNNFVTI